MSDLIAVAVVDLKAGAALDWAVAKAVGIEVKLTTEFASLDNGGQYVGMCCFPIDGRRPYMPSTNWAQGGTLIDQGCGLFHCGSETGAGSFWSCSFGTHPDLRSQTGSTALEAVCKAIVALKLGDAVTVPRELVEVQS